MIQIRVNKTNSKIVNGKLFIEKNKAYKLKPKQFEECISMENKITYPGIGEMYQYEGPYSRS